MYSQTLKDALDATGLDVPALLRKGALSPNERSVLRLSSSKAYLRAFRLAYASGEALFAMGFRTEDFERGWLHGLEAKRWHDWAWPQAQTEQ